MPSIPSCEVSQNWFGKHSVKYQCPHCGERLRSPLRDAGRTDNCPACRNRFVVPGLNVLEQVSAKERAAAERTSRAKAELTEAKRLEQERRNRKRAELRQKAEEERQEREKVAQDARHEQDQLAREAQRVQVEAASSVEANTNRERRANKHISWRSGGTIVAITAIGLTIYWVSRGSDLRSQLDRCDSKDVVNVRVSYADIFGTETVVFDLRDSGSAGAAPDRSCAFTDAVRRQAGPLFRSSYCPGEKRTSPVLHFRNRSAAISRFVRGRRCAVGVQQPPR